MKRVESELVYPKNSSPVRIGEFGDFIAFIKICSKPTPVLDALDKPITRWFVLMPSVSVSLKSTVVKLFWYGGQFTLFTRAEKEEFLLVPDDPVVCFLHEIDTKMSKRVIDLM
jgi:hypothetical protein